MARVQCAVCNATFTGPPSLARHIRDDHSEWLWKDSQCSGTASHGTDATGSAPATSKPSGSVPSHIVRCQSAENQTAPASKGPTSSTPRSGSDAATQRAQGAPPLDLDDQKQPFVPPRESGRTPQDRIADEALKPTKPKHPKIAPKPKIDPKPPLIAPKPHIVSKPQVVRPLITPKPKPAPNPQITTKSFNAAKQIIAPGSTFAPTPPVSVPSPVVQIPSQYITHPVPQAPPPIYNTGYQTYSIQLHPSPPGHRGFHGSSSEYPTPISYSQPIQQGHSWIEQSPPTLFVPGPPPHLYPGGHPPPHIFVPGAPQPHLLIHPQSSFPPLAHWDTQMPQAQAPAKTPPQRAPRESRIEAPLSPRTDERIFRTLCRVHYAQVRAKSIKSRSAVPAAKPQKSTASSKPGTSSKSKISSAVKHDGQKSAVKAEKTSLKAPSDSVTSASKFIVASNTTRPATLITSPRSGRTIPIQNPISAASPTASLPSPTFRTPKVIGKTKSHSISYASHLGTINVKSKHQSKSSPTIPGATASVSIPKRRGRPPKNAHPKAVAGEINEENLLQSQIRKEAGLD